MSGIEKHAEFYRGYLADDRSVAPVAGVLISTIAVWLLFYLVSVLDPVPNGAALASAPDAGRGSWAADPWTRSEPTSGR